MSDDATDSNPFWDFSLAIYARPKLAAACLALQDRLGSDVNLLLFCLWAGHCGHRLTTKELGELHAVAEPWHDSVVRPLRGVRRWLKQSPAGARGAAPGLRQGVKQLELDAERLEQDLLHGCLPLGSGVSDRAAARANLTACLGRQVDEVEVLLAETFA